MQTAERDLRVWDRPTVTGHGRAVEGVECVVTFSAPLYVDSSTTIERVIAAGAPHEVQPVIAVYLVNAAGTSRTKKGGQSIGAIVSDDEIQPVATMDDVVATEIFGAWVEQVITKEEIRPFVAMDTVIVDDRGDVDYEFAE